jgi:primosomal protein N'
MALTGARQQSRQVLMGSSTPRLEARNKRVRLAHEARDEFSRRVLVILSASARLRETPIRDSLAEQRPALAEKLI